MNLAKRLLLTTRYYSTSLSRWEDKRRRRAEGNVPVHILFYHRIADSHPNGWTMPCETFARQISWLQRNFRIVGLQEAQRLIASGANHSPTVCITFDDGYADNTQFAIPLLLDRKIPFTYFVCSANIRQRQPFPHDVAAGLPLEPNQADELRQLAERGVEIGAHSRTHADLGQLSGETLREEIVDSKHEIEQLTGKSVNYMAFPFGLHQNLSREAFRIAREAGYLGVCSAYGGYNFPGSDPFHLERFHADCEMIRFRTWLGVDPRKVQLVKSYPWKEGEVASDEPKGSFRSLLKAGRLMANERAGN